MFITVNKIYDNISLILQHIFEIENISFYIEQFKFNVWYFIYYIVQLKYDKNFNLLIIVRYYEILISRG